VKDLELQRYAGAKADADCHHGCENNSHMGYNPKSSNARGHAGRPCAQGDT